MTNVHGIQSTTTTTVVNDINSKISNNKKPTTTTTTNTVKLKQTPQVQLRVTCQVCKKVRRIVFLLKILVFVFVGIV